MKDTCLKPTQGNIYQTLIDDSIKRRDDLKNFLKILDSVEEGFSIALQGNWGCGKTFFVKQLKMILDAFNSDKSDLDEEKIRRIREIFSDGESVNKYKAVYFDAWMHDDESDPLLSLLYAIIQDEGIRLKNSCNSDLLDIAGEISKLLFNKNPFAIVKSIKDITGKNPLQEVQKERSVYDLTEDFIGKLLSSANRLVLFIDELDRCKPTYAVQLLERVKHYFDDDRIIVVYSVNTSQLTHTIRKCYGENFSAGAYLERFFSISVDIPRVDMRRFVSTLQGFETAVYTVYTETCLRFIRVYSLELRQMSRYLEMAKSAAPTETATFTILYRNDAFAYELCATYFVPIMIGLKVYDVDLYESFIKGENSAPLLNTVTEDVLSEYWITKLTSDLDTENKAERLKIAAERLDDCYKALFVRKYHDANDFYDVGREIRFTARTYREILQKVSMLGYNK